MIISQNLLRLRQEKKMSLDKLAESSGLSKALLSQIEHGDANPTVNSLWKIAVGLKVSFKDLIQEAQPQISIARKKDIIPIIDHLTGMKLYPIFSNSNKQIEIFIAELDPGKIHTAPSHGENSDEYVFVIEGMLLFNINDDAYKLEAGDTLCFQSDQPHSYKNIGTEKVQFQCTLHRK